MNGHLNQTIMDIPSMPMLGNDMDKTVRFKPDDSRNFKNGSVGLSSTI